MFRSPLFWKLLLSDLLLIVVTVFVVDLRLTREAANRQTAAIEQQLQAEGRLLSAEVREVPAAALETWAKSAAGRALARITVIDSRGVVLADSEHDPESMENHAGRPEVSAALAGRIGAATRRSATLGRDLCYVGLPLEYAGRRGYVLRLAVPLENLERAAAEARRGVWGATLVAVLLALAVAYVSARLITRRIDRLRTFAEQLSVSGVPDALPAESDDELGALARSLTRMATGLERLERVRKDFVANVSHELRTPLTAIQGYTETLLDGALEDPENNRKFLEIIRAHAARLNNIASDLLTLSELESGAPPPAPERVAIRAAVENALRTVEPEAAARTVRLSAGSLEDADVLGQRLRLEQALVNLVNNAVKFNRPGGEVRVDARRSDGQVRISVADTGIGIPQDDLSRIFERFYRVDKARSREVGGTGLGLSIVKHAVERMNGAVTVESEVGKGSTFTVTLPAAS